MTDRLAIADASRVSGTLPCPHGVIRDVTWCEPCFRKEQRARWGYSPHDYCDYLGRGHG